MTRHSALHDLSRDHQAMLLHAKRLEEGREHTVLAGRAFLRYWDQSLIHHLQEEMDQVVPATKDMELTIQIHTLAQDLEFLVDLLRFSVLDTSTLDWNASRLADSLRRHVRVLEWELFDELQEDLTEADLAALGAGLAAHRNIVRPDSVGPNATEPVHLGGAAPNPDWDAEGEAGEHAPRMGMPGAGRPAPAVARRAPETRLPGGQP
ncbi:MAG: hypothetical protein ACYDBQ_09085 [Thermoplasmatota archaeon]